jgi:hypothetical protein
VKAARAEVVDLFMTALVVVVGWRTLWGRTYSTQPGRAMRFRAFELSYLPAVRSQKPHFKCAKVNGLPGANR